MRGEDELIASNDDDTDERVVRLVAVSVVDGQHAAEFGSGKGLFRMADDFDDPLPDFAAYR